MMAGTTGLEPATSAVTVSPKPVTSRNNGQWMAPLEAKRNTRERLSWPYCVHKFNLTNRVETSAVQRHYSPRFRTCLCRRTAEVAASMKRRNVEACRNRRRAGEKGAQLCPRLAESCLQDLCRGSAEVAVWAHPNHPRIRSLRKTVSRERCR